MTEVVRSIEGEYRRYKALAEGALAQLSEAELNARPLEIGNSIATICRHVAGNFKSRFTDFLTTDGEKPWRDREGEFSAAHLSRAELDASWTEAWAVVLGIIASLSDADLQRTVFIRKQSLLVHEALHRSLAHVAYHVGQIVDRAHTLRGVSWTYLTIPPGGTAAYNANPVHEKPMAHTNAITERTGPA